MRLLQKRNSGHSFLKNMKESTVKEENNKQIFSATLICKIKNKDICAYRILLNFYYCNVLVHL